MTGIEHSLHELEHAHQIAASAVEAAWIMPEITDHQVIVALGNYVIMCGMLESAYREEVNTGIVQIPRYKLFDEGLKNKLDPDNIEMLASYMYDSSDGEEFVWSLAYVDETDSIPGIKFPNNRHDRHDRVLHATEFIEGLLQTARD